MVDQIRFFAGAARVLEGRRPGSTWPGHTSWIRREPIGVVGQVTPWNYPMMMAVWKFAPALAAGNTVVLKPSDTTPETTLLLAEIAAEFLPPGVLNVITGDRDTGRAAGRAPDARRWSRSPARCGPAWRSPRAAADDLKRVHLELGGKAPVVVFDDADLEAAAEAIAVAGYFNAGQDCTAATRVLAAPGVHDDFVAALAEQAAARPTVGLPGRRGRALRRRSTTPTSSTGCSGFLDRLPDHADGRRRRHRRRRPRRRLLPRADRRRRPAPGRRGRSRTRSSARSSPCSGSPTRTRRCAGPTASSTAWPPRSGPRTSAARCGCRRRLDFGCVWINTHIPLVAEMPHGGFKHSGYGKDLSMYGFEDYTRIKHVMANIES